MKEEFYNNGYFFEGAEKRLEVDFSETSESPKDGMRLIPREKWEDILSLVKCLILSVSSSDVCDAYVLSESSLFVYPLKILIKTCGNTTLLECLPRLLKLAQDVHLDIDYVTYSHKNFMTPELQEIPYRNFDSEVEILNKYFPGRGHVLGPNMGDQWFIYVADLSQSPSATCEAEQTIEIIMTKLDRSAMKQFYQTCANHADLRAKISSIIPGSFIDDHLFDPCGYSMNGLYNRYYSTVHVTPEPAFSYVSFESNVPVSSYDAIIKRVLDIFKPSKFIISVFADSLSLCGDSNRSYDSCISGFRRESTNICEFVGRRSVSCSHYSLLKEN